MGSPQQVLFIIRRNEGILMMDKASLTVKADGLTLNTWHDNSKNKNEMVIEKRGIFLTSNKGTKQETRLLMFDNGDFRVLKSAGDHIFDLTFSESLRMARLNYNNNMLRLNHDGKIDLLAEKDILIRSTGGDVRIEGQRVLLNE
jgi:hypothetical protein